MDKRFFLLMVTFLIVGLVPTIICIIYPPQFAIIEKQTTNGVNVGLNNWYKTRDYPSVDLPEKLVQKLENQDFLPKNINITQDGNKKAILLQKETSKIIKSLQFYGIDGRHKQTTYLVNNENQIDISNLNGGNYLILLDIDGTVFLKKLLLK